MDQSRSNKCSSRVKFSVSMLLDGVLVDFGKDGPSSLQGQPQPPHTRCHWWSQTLPEKHPHILPEPSQEWDQPPGAPQSWSMGNSGWNPQPSPHLVNLWGQKWLQLLPGPSKSSACGWDLLGRWFPIQVLSPQQLQHHLWICQKCMFSGSMSDLQNQKLEQGPGIWGLSRLLEDSVACQSEMLPHVCLGDRVWVLQSQESPFLSHRLLEG